MVNNHGKRSDFQPVAQTENSPFSFARQRNASIVSLAKVSLVWLVFLTGQTGSIYFDFEDLVELVEFNDVTGNLVNVSLSSMLRQVGSINLAG